MTAHAWAIKTSCVLRGRGCCSSPVSDDLVVDVPRKRLVVCELNLSVEKEEKRNDTDYNL